MGLDLLDGKSVLCKWTKDGKHLNFGTRKYNDLEAFVNDVKLPKKDVKQGD